MLQTLFLKAEDRFKTHCSNHHLQALHLNKCSPQNSLIEVFSILRGFKSKVGMSIFIQDI